MLVSVPYSYLPVHFRLRRQREGRFKPVTVHHVKDKGDVSLSSLTVQKMKVRSEKEVDKKSSDKENLPQDEQVYENTTFIGR